MDMTDMQDNVVQNSPNNMDKWRWSLYIALIYLIISNPYSCGMIKTFVSSSGMLASDNFMLFFNALLLLVLVRLLMNYKL